MLHRLPLELELIIIELAAPPLVKPRLVERVDFFIKISLVHRSFTAWAQERLHDQFLYTYRPRDDEYARLECRLTVAGFGPTRPIKRLYLDATRLRRSRDRSSHDQEVEITPETAGGVETGSSANESFQATDAQIQLTTHGGHGVFDGNFHGAYFGWTLGSSLLTRCVQSLATLWLMPPDADASFFDLSIISALHLLDVDREAFDAIWLTLGDLPFAQHTTLLLRKTNLALSPMEDLYPIRSLILNACEVYQCLRCFPELEIFIACETFAKQPGYGWLPSTVRHVHILHRDFQYVDIRPVPAATFPALESLTFTWLQPGAGESGNPAADVANPLLKLRRFVESTIVAPQCTFKYLRSTNSSEDALADAMADLGLDS